MPVQQYTATTKNACTIRCFGFNIHSLPQPSASSGSKLRVARDLLAFCLAAFVGRCASPAGFSLASVLSPILRLPLGTKLTLSPT